MTILTSSSLFRPPPALPRACPVEPVGRRLRGIPAGRPEQRDITFGPVIAPVGAPAAATQSGRPAPRSESLGHASMAPSRPVTRLIQRGRCLGRRAAAFFSLSRRRAGPAPTVARGGHCAERAQERRSQGAQRDRANRRLRGFRAPPPRRPAASAAQAGAGGDCGLPQGREHPLCNTEILQRRIAHQHAPPSPPLPPEAALAPQCAMCGILDGYVGQHSVKTRYGNAMPCLFRYLQVDGMPPHPNLPPGSKPAGDGRPAGRRHAAALERRREGRAQRGKAVHGRARASQERPRHVCRIEKDDDHDQRPEPRHGGGKGRNLRPCRSRLEHTRRAAE